MSKSEFLNSLNSEISTCKAIIKKSKSRLNALPTGKLRVAMSDKRVCYYYCQEDNQGKYIRKSDTKLAINLARKEKNEDAYERASGALRVLIPVKNYFERNDWRETGSRMHPEKVKLSNDEAITVFEKAKKWEMEPYEKYEDVDSSYITKKGERVRSKSELIIADILFDYGIPYHYEQILRLKDNRIIVPDFTIFDIYRGKFVYFEHFGMMSDPSYCESVQRKLEKYAANGHYLYVDVFFSFESETFKMPTEILKKYLINCLAA